MIRRLALSGLLCSGKDYVAEKAGFEIESFAKPLYALARYFFGTDDKTIPEIRRFMQIVGQWGWGAADEKYPYSMERALMVGLLRCDGATIIGMSEYQWHQFGASSDFWVRGLLARIERPFSRHLRIAVTNVRYEHEIEPLKAAGFEHFVIACTHGERERRNGKPISHDVNEDISEAFARRCLGEYPDNQIIWNDSWPMPAGKKYLTVDQFVEIAKEK